MSKKKRCYLASQDESDYIVAFVAYSHKEAHRMAIVHEDFVYSNNPWIDTRIKWLRKIDATQYPIGELDFVEGLKLDIYNGIYGWECEECFQDSFVTYFEERLICDDCKNNLVKSTP